MDSGESGGVSTKRLKVAVWVSKEHKNVSRFEVIDVQSGESGLFGK